MPAESRADAILAAYDQLPDTDDKEDIQVILLEAVDGAPDGSKIESPIHDLIRESFTTDDDFDDLRHEIEHAMGECDGLDEDCPWEFDDLDD